MIANDGVNQSLVAFLISFVWYVPQCSILVPLFGLIALLMSFSSSQVWMWELDYKESWAPKNWCFWTVVLEKTLESPLDCKETQLVNPKGDQSWIFIGKTDAEADVPILWPPDAKSWLIGKESDGGRDWGQEEKGTREDEMAGWHHWLNGRESEWTPGVGDGQGGLACCDSWGRKESDTTEWLNWTAKVLKTHIFHCCSNLTLRNLFQGNNLVSNNLCLHIPRW